MFTPDRKEAEKFARQNGMIVVWTNYTKDSDRICYATIKPSDLDKWVESGWEPVEIDPVLDADLLSLEATAPDDDDEPTDVEIVRAVLMDDEMWGRMQEETSNGTNRLHHFWQE